MILSLIASIRMLSQAECYLYFLMEAVAWRPIFTLVAYDRKSIRTRRFCRWPAATTNDVRP